MKKLIVIIALGVQLLGESQASERYNTVEYKFNKLQEMYSEQDLKLNGVFVTLGKCTLNLETDFHSHESMTIGMEDDQIHGDFYERLRKCASTLKGW